MPAHLDRSVKLFLKYFLPVAVGSVLYASCRSSTLLYERLIRFVIGLNWINIKLRLNYVCSEAISSDWIYSLTVYSLPNALWHLSLCYFLEQSLRTFFGRASILWRFRLILFLILALLFDFLQLINFMSGIADSFDVLFTLLTSAIVYLTTAL